jgi:hypothetical protein
VLEPGAALLHDRIVEALSADYGIMAVAMDEEVRDRTIEVVVGWEGLLTR